MFLLFFKLNMRNKNVMIKTRTEWNHVPEQFFSTGEYIKSTKHKLVSVLSLISYSHWIWLSHFSMRNIVSLLQCDHFRSEISKGNWGFTWKKHDGNKAIFNAVAGMSWYLSWLDCDRLPFLQQLIQLNSKVNRHITSCIKDRV